MPNNINDVSFSGDTVLAGYQPPWVKHTDPAWKQNLGYQFAGFAGIGFVVPSGSASSGLAAAVMPTPRLIGERPE